MNVTNLDGKVALVTGAASGIGRETALELARRGATLVVCDVDEKGLEATEGDIRALGREVLARRADVGDREQMRLFAEDVHEQVEALDILVNNAGVGLGGEFLDTTLEDWDWIVGINLMGVVHGCHFFLPPIVRRGRGGHVVNVSSMLGYTAAEAAPAYCATKFAVLGLSKVLRQEFQRKGIGVTAICPGLIDTSITQSSRLRGVAAKPEVRERMAQIYRRRGYGPDRVARSILHAIHRNRALAPVSLEAWLLYYMTRFVPGLSATIDRKLAERFRRQVGIET